MASGGQKIVFYETKNFEPSYEFGNYAEPVYSIDWSNDSKYLLIAPSSGYSEIIRPYLTEARSLQTIKIKGVRSACFYKNTHRYICIGCNNGTIHIWDTKKQETHKKMQTIYSNVTCIDVSNSDHYMSAGCEDGKIVVYGLTTNKKMDTLNIESTSWPITSLKYSSKELGMFGATNDHGFVCIWNVVKRKTPLFMAKKHSSISSGIALSPINTNFFVSVGYDHLICMCDLRTKQSVCNREAKYALTSVDMSTDGLMMMCGHRQGGILIYDLRNNKEPMLNIMQHSGIVTSVAFQRTVKDINKDKEPEASIEQNFSVECNKSAKNCSALIDQGNDSFLNLLDDMKENIYSPNIPQTPKGEVDAFINDFNSPVINEPNFLKNSSGFETEIVINSESTTNNCLSPINPVQQDQEERVQLFKSTPIVPQIEPQLTRSISNKEDTNLEISRSEFITLKNDFDELRKQTTQMMEMHKTSMLRLHMLLCTQHLQLMNKFDDGTAVADSLELKKEVTKLRSENEMLAYELEIMRSERNKYLSRSSPSNST